MSEHIERKPIERAPNERGGGPKKPATQGPKAPSPTPAQKKA